MSLFAPNPTHLDRLLISPPSALSLLTTLVVYTIIVFRSGGLGHSPPSTAVWVSNGLPKIGGKGARSRTFGACLFLISLADSLDR